MISHAHVSPEVFALRPDYRAGLLLVNGLEPHGTSATSEALLVQAEEHAARLLADSPVEELAHIAQWREAYVAFGAKPQRTRNSLEALTRRASQGLPRVNQLTDIYNAISVLHQIPLGGEDVDCYVGSPRLVRATGTELFETMADGATSQESPEVGEVVWVDDVGVTCRRWNWRQGIRTRLQDSTTNALFIVDALAAITDAELSSILEELQTQFAQLGSNVTFESRIVSGT